MNYKMTTIIDLYSLFRDREVYPNPFNYHVNEKQVESWFKHNRSVTPLPQNPNMRPLDFMKAVKLQRLILPYSATLADEPRVYVNFRSQEYRDTRLINTIDGRLPDIKFVCNYRRIQNDSLGNPLWIQYDCDTPQVMRFELKSPVVFQVILRDGTILSSTDTIPPLDPDPQQQSFCTFELTPYMRFNGYDNKTLEYLNT